MLPLLGSWSATLTPRHTTYFLTISSLFRHNSGTLSSKTLLFLIPRLEHITLLRLFVYLCVCNYNCWFAQLLKSKEFILFNDCTQQMLTSFIKLKKYIYLLIWLHQVLVKALWILDFCCVMGNIQLWHTIPQCAMWDPVPRRGIEPSQSVQSLSRV